MRLRAATARTGGNRWASRHRRQRQRAVAGRAGRHPRRVASSGASSGGCGAWVTCVAPARARLPGRHRVGGDRERGTSTGACIGVCGWDGAVPDVRAPSHHAAPLPAHHTHTYSCTCAATHCCRPSAMHHTWRQCGPTSPQRARCEACWHQGCCCKAAGAERTHPRNGRCSLPAATAVPGASLLCFSRHLSAPVTSPAPPGPRGGPSRQLTTIGWWPAGCCHRARCSCWRVRPPTLACACGGASQKAACRAPGAAAAVERGRVVPAAAAAGTATVAAVTAPRVGSRRIARRLRWRRWCGVAHARAPHCGAASRCLHACTQCRQGRTRRRRATWHQELAPLPHAPLQVGYLHLTDPPRLEQLMGAMQAGGPVTPGGTAAAEQSPDGPS